MLRPSTYIATLLCLLVGCHVSLPANPARQGSGMVVTSKRAVGSFTKIEFRGTGMVSTQNGDTADVVVSIDDNLQELIAVYVEDETLIIESTDQFRSQPGLKVTVATPHLEEIRLSGATSLKALGIDADNFQISVSGAASAHVTGKTRGLSLDVNGAGSVQAFDLVAENVKATLNGAASGEVHATMTLDVDASGASSIRYKGDPDRVTKQLSGAASARSASH